jgi:ferritin
MAAFLAKLTKHERQEAMRMLMHLGLFFYFKESHSTTVNLNTLCDLCGTSKSHLDMIDVEVVSVCCMHRKA